MNKTIIININSIVFHIEEDAYEMLRMYMIDVKKHFAYTEGNKEIVDDIENRIAEMFNERIVAGKKEVITIQDVEEVCAQMGKVSDFEVGGEEGNDPYSQRGYYNRGYREQRKLFRDPDDKVFGGVCSGLGHYLDIETLWVRLAIVLLFIFAGTGFLLYVILWIVVPVAKTRADRMAMRGEAPNLQNFKKNFEEEMEGLRGNFTMAGESIKPGLNKAGEALEGVANVIAKVFVIFLKIIGAVIIFGLCAGLVGLLISVVLAIPSWENHQMNRFYGPDFPLYLIAEPNRAIVLSVSLFVLAIPLVALIILAFRIVFNRRLAGSYVGFGLLMVWLIAAGTLSYYAIQTSHDFVEDASVVQERSLEAQARYYIDVNDVNKIKMTDSSSQSADSLSTIIRSNKRTGKFRNVWSADIYIVKGDTNTTPKLIKELKASGSDFEVAVKRAERMMYNVHQQGEHMVFDSHSTIPKGELIRNQAVTVKMVLPVGTKIFISNEADRYVRNLPVWQCRDRYPEGSRHDVYTEWLMTEEGLRCVAEDKENQEGEEDTIDSIGVTQG